MAFQAQPERLARADKAEVAQVACMRKTALMVTMVSVAEVAALGVQDKKAVMAALALSLSVM